jgi:drug/metabolite transporter, DME family
LAYAASNICMRQLTVMRCDPFWAVFNRELTTTIIAGACLLFQRFQGRPTLPSRSILLRLVCLGVIVQLVGAMCLQWALGIVGLAVTVPFYFGARIVGVALLGYAWIGERVSTRSKLAIGVLLASLALLGRGVSASGGSLAAADVPFSLWLLILGILAAIVSGAVAAMLSISIRDLATDSTMPLTTVFLIPLMAVVSLAPFCAMRLTTTEMWGTPWQEWVCMVDAGVFNFIAFLALAKGLQLATAVYVNSVGVLQVAVSAMAGILLFAEPMNLWLALGIGLMMAGILAVDRPVADGEL